MVEVTPNFAIGYYILILIGYLVYKTVNIPMTGGTKQEVISPLIAGIFATVIVVGEMMISVGMTKTVCGFEQWDIAAMFTIIPWVLIVGAVKLALIARPGWLVPFSNTFGYFLSSAAFGLVEAFRQILKPKVILSKDGEEEADKSANSRNVAKALQEIYEDESLLINQMTPDNIMGTIKKFSTVGLMYTADEYASTPENQDNPNAASIYQKYIEALKKAVWFKLFVSEFVWLLISGILAISVTYNYIMNYGCKMTAEQIAKKSQNMDAVNAASADQAKNNEPDVSVSTD
jgi:hypothetical protein